MFINHIVKSLVVSLCYASVVVADCGSVRIVSQADADVASRCITITGDVIIAKNATGHISLDGVRSIVGSLTNEPCFYQDEAIFVDIEYTSAQFEIGWDIEQSYKFCFGLLSLSSSTLVSISQNLTMQNLLNLTSISLPSLETIGSPLYLDGLPALINLTISRLRSVEVFHLAYAPLLRSIDMTGLTNASSVYINSVGLDSVPVINVNTKISSFVIGGVPNMAIISLWTPYIGTLQVNGNGFANLATYNVATNVAVKTIETLTASGCGYMRITNEADNPSIGNLFITGNSFQNLDLSRVSISSVYIQSNSLLESISWDPSTMVMDALVVADNALLNNFVNFEVQNLSSLVLKGSFNQNFLSVYQCPIVASTKFLLMKPRNFRLEYVFGQFLVASTDPSVNCSAFNKMVQRGYSGKGGYSCQGNSTLTAGSASLIASSLWLAFIPLMIFCVQI